MDSSADVKLRNWSIVVPTDEFDAEVLKQVIDEGKIKFGIHRREISEEGFDHTHVVLSFGEPTRNSAIRRIFPNIVAVQSVKKLEAIIEYIQKDDTGRGPAITIGEVPKTILTKIENKNHGGSSMLKAALLQPTYTKAIEVCEEINVWEYVRNKKAIESYLCLKFEPKLEVQPIINFDPSIVNKITFCGRQQAILLVGPSGVGKTQLALSYFQNPCVVTCKQDFGHFKTHSGMVIDDLPWSNHAPETLVRLLNTEIPQTIDIKYGSAYIPCNTRKIFTLNTELQFWPHTLFNDNDKNVKPELEEVYKAIKSRIKVIHVLNSVFIK